jgi:hypothetical protein
MAGCQHIAAFGAAQRAITIPRRRLEASINSSQCRMSFSAVLNAGARA